MLGIVEVVGTSEAGVPNGLNVDPVEDVAAKGTPGFLLRNEEVMGTSEAEAPDGLNVDSVEDAAAVGASPERDPKMEGAELPLF